MQLLQESLRKKVQCSAEVPEVQCLLKNHRPEPRGGLQTTHYLTFPGFFSLAVTLDNVTHLYCIFR